LPSPSAVDLAVWRRLARERRAAALGASSRMSGDQAPFTAPSFSASVAIASHRMK